jgi:C-terminal processing protease CtpA/Prc/Tol biopolymer transport system component
MKKILLVCALIFSLTSISAPLWMRYPSISPDGSKIAFTYQGDIFVVNTTGGRAIQVTTNNAIDFMPIWSTDGSTIAFASNRNGNFDVYKVSNKGGTPIRMTFHSSNDYPYTFSPDDKKILFGSNRLDKNTSVQFPYARLNELYSVPTNGGREIQELTIAAEDVKYSKDGKTLLFHNKKGYEDPWRKHHTSSVTRDIVSYNTASKAYNTLTKWNGEDRNPIDIDGNNFYFLSEKSGTFNVWKGNATKPYGEQITKFDTHPVRFLSQSNTNVLCFGYDGEIYTQQNGEAKKVKIEIFNDQTFKSVMPSKVTGGVSDFSVSPDGKEVAFIHRGEVFVTSVEYATTKKLTNTPEQERSVSFSPDGKKVLYTGERNGSWNIYESSIKRENEKHFYNATLIEEKELVNNGEETFQPLYSPDGKEVAFLENRTTIRAINLASNKIRTILGGEFNYSYSDGDQYYTWSPDSKHILAQFFEFERWTSDIGLIDASGKKAPINLTKSGYGNGNAKFAMDGEMIYYSTGKYGYRSHGSWGGHSDVEAIFLTKDAYYKFKLNKEEYAEWKTEQEDLEKSDDDAKDEKKDISTKLNDQEEKTVEPIKIDLDGLFDRKLRLTIHSSALSDFVINNEATEMHYLANFEKGHDLWKTEFKDSKTKIVSKLGSWSGKLEFDKDEKNIFFSKRGGINKLDVASGKIEPVAINSEMTINPAAERAYMFDHAWRQVREKFYVKDLHGVDWELMKKEYGKFLPHINNGFDFSEMLSELLGELNASHTGARYRMGSASGDKTASLGCFFDESYTKDGLKILEIMDKSPLTKNNTKIKAGDVITKIDGIDIKANENYYGLLNRKTGKRVLLTVKSASGETFEMVVKPISTWEEGNLTYNRWIKNCEAQVDKLSDGRLGYVHIKGMNSSSFRELFDRALGQLNKKEALIIDTRFNGGGWLHDDLATFLSGKMYMKFMPRGQKNMGGEPIWKWQKPSCVLMSEGNYSDAHLFPYTYKALGIGKLIGMPVPGTGTAVWWETMIDGKTVFGIPQIGMQSVTEGYLVENHELQPDIQVNNEYSKFINGIDQQLEAAVTEMLK